MIQIYHTDSSIFEQRYSLDELLNSLPKVVQVKALRYKNKRAAYNFVLGRLLLKHGIDALDLPNHLLEKITYSENDKPLLEDLHFSISHSGEKVLCAISKTVAMGIDVEVLRDFDIAIFKTWFTPTEWKAINAAKNPSHHLLYLWTKKESLLKASGYGLSKLMEIQFSGLTKGRIGEENKTWYLQNVALGTDCFVSLCYEREVMIHLNCKCDSFKSLT